MSMLFFIVLQYYVNLYRQGEPIHNSLINEVIPSLVFDTQNLFLVTVPSEKEIFDTINDINSSSTLGPDGFGRIFFKSCQEHIKSDLVASVQQFFMTSYLPDNFNIVHLISMPNVKVADSVELYRPIPLANF